MNNNDYYERRTAMVDRQIRPSDVTKYPIIDAMLEIPREDFVPDSFREMAYIGDHISIGNGRAILDPRILAKMLNEIDIRPDELVLDIGSGLGYSSAVISRMAEVVVALEEDEAMSKESETILSKHYADNVVPLHGRLAEGAARHGPYDVIVVQGGFEALPGAIVDQLKDGGRVVGIFASGPAGECRTGIKQGNGISWRMEFNADAPVLPGFERKKEFIF